MIANTRKHLALLTGLAALAAVGSPARAQLSSLPPAAPLTVTHITDRLIQIEQGAYRMFALNTTGGIVFIDTQPTPGQTREAIRLAQNEFKRKDIAWLIDTHEHLDHIMGNAAFAGTPILASEGTLEGIRATEPLIKGYLVPVEQSLAKARLQRDSLPKGSAAYDSAAQRIANTEAMVAAVQQGVVLPTLTFTDRLTLHAGDRTVRLVAAGQRHSYGDVLIHLPEEHVLFTVGTANPVGYIPYVSKISHAQDIQRVVAVFGQFSDPSLGLTHIITGHGPELKREDLAFAGAYYDRLWKKLSGMQGTGGTVEQAKQQLALESAFVDMLPAGAIPEASKKTHTHNIEALWALLEPAPAAADKAAPR